MSLSMWLFQTATAGHVWWYRLTDGRLAGGDAVILLTTTGAKSGKERTVPLNHLDDGDRILVAASAGGSPRRPGWYHNLMANTEAFVQVGAVKGRYVAHRAPDEEQAELYAGFVERWKGFEKYEERAGRPIPVVILEPQR